MLNNSTKRTTPPFLIFFLCEGLISYLTFFSVFLWRLSCLHSSNIQSVSWLLILTWSLDLLKHPCFHDGWKYSTSVCRCVLWISLFGSSQFRRCLASNTAKRHKTVNPSRLQHYWRYLGGVMLNIHPSGLCTWHGIYNFVFFPHFVATNPTAHVSGVFYIPVSLSMEICGCVDPSIFAKLATPSRWTLQSLIALLSFQDSTVWLKSTEDLLSVPIVVSSH